MTKAEVEVKEEAGSKPASFSLEAALSTVAVGLCNYFIKDIPLSKLVGTASVALGYVAAKLVRWGHKEFILWRLCGIIEAEITALEKEKQTLGLSVKRRRGIDQDIAERRAYLSKRKRDNLT